jgi:hypothetical protein
MTASYKCHDWRIGLPLLLLGFAGILAVAYWVVALLEDWIPDLQFDSRNPELPFERAVLLGISEISIGNVQANLLAGKLIAETAEQYIREMNLTPSQTEVYNQLLEEDYTGTVDRLIATARSFG